MWCGGKCGLPHALALCSYAARVEQLFRNILVPRFIDTAFVSMVKKEYLFITKAVTNQVGHNIL